MNPHPIYTLLLIIALWLSASNVVARQPGNSSIIGKWYVDDKTAIFDFYQTGESVSAKLIPLAKPNIVDTLNPVDSLKNRRLSGATLICGLVFEVKQNRWEGGKVYNPENGKTYSCDCKLDKSGNCLFFRGYLGIELLGETRTWTRVVKSGTHE
jgi:uncharacterized protein (DUF2147 family)